MTATPTTPTSPAPAPAPPAAGPGSRSARARRRLNSGLVLVLMVIVAIVMLYPFYYLLDNAFRNQTQFDRQHGHSAAGWTQLFQSLPVGSELLNSTIVCAAAIVIILIVATTAGFAFAKLRYRGSGLVFLFVVAALMVPLQSIIIPEYVNLAKFHLISSYTGAVLVYAALGAPFATFLMATYYRGISDELIEAAVMDGLSYERTFLQIALPLSLPAIATVTVLQFIQIWDDLLVGLLFLPTNDRTITVGVAALSSGRTTSIPALMAGSLISAVPAILVYLIFQRHLVKGLTLGMGK
ncbi:MAG TPA: carbohydrate ABC transporter permease [Streptosporangiaceae bacterium]|nr:carbohydrate ABC transporter permease [Streptosporangiaceae bacterium]